MQHRWNYHFDQARFRFLAEELQEESAMILLRRQFSYSKLENEDPDETKHRKAQFLIYRTMKKAEGRRRPSWIRVRILRFKMKLGRRLKVLKKGFSSAAPIAAKGSRCMQIGGVLKSWKHLIHGKQIVTALPPAVF